MKTIVIGADHAGFKLKEKIKKHLSKKYRVVDIGATRLIPTDDYPDYAFKLGERIVKHNELGILVCGSAEGVCIAANKVRGVRAVAPWSKEIARLSREHNDANVLCLSGWKMSLKKAKGIIDSFLSASMSEERRHHRRVNKIIKYEK